MKITTTFSNELNEKVFILKGSEDYARTTDTLMEVNTGFGDYKGHMGYFRIGVELNVLRDIGESTILIRDGGETLLTIPWSDDPTSISGDGYYWDANKQRLVVGYDTSHTGYENTGVKLAYNSEHDIYVQYMGNKKCLSSKSHSVSLYEESPSSFESTIMYTGTSSSFDRDNPPIYLRFRCGQELYDELEKNLKIYVDDVYNQTIVFEMDEGAMSKDINFTIPHLSDGLHTIRAVFDGDENCYSSETSFDISVGYKVSIVEYPSTVFDLESLVVTGRVLDYFNNPIDVWTYNTAKAYLSTSSSHVSTGVDIGNDGYVTLTKTGSYDSPQQEDYMIHVQTANNTTGWYSETGHCNRIFSYDISLDSDVIYTYPSNTQKITGTLDGISSQVPISITGDYTDSLLSDNDNPSTFSYDYVGEGRGLLLTNWYLKNKYVSLDIYDMDLYWNNKKNIQYNGLDDLTILDGAITKQSNGWRLFDTIANKKPTIEFTPPSDKYQIEFNIVARSSEGISHLRVVQDGTEYSLNMGSKGTVNVLIKQDNDNFYAEVNGSESDSLTLPVSSGKIGFGMWNHAKLGWSITIDDLKVVKLNEGSL